MNTIIALDALGGVPIWVDCYVPQYAAPTKSAVRRWRWWDRWFGRPYPRGPEVWLEIRDRRGRLERIAMNPATYAKLKAEMERPGGALAIPPRE